MMQKEHSDSARQKREYQTPRLTRYGALRDLTQSGSGNKTEDRNHPWTNRKSAASDRNVKENIVRIGEHPLGIDLYLFDYKPEFSDEWGYGRQFGVMAQEVETVMPEAVCTHPDGYRMVHYGMLGIDRKDR